MKVLESELPNVGWGSQMLAGVAFEPNSVLIKKMNEFSYFARFSKQEPNMVLLERVGEGSNTREYASRLVRVPPPETRPAVSPSLQKALQQALDSELANAQWKNGMIAGVSFETTPVLVREAATATEFSYFARFSKQEPNMVLFERVGGGSNTHEYASRRVHVAPQEARPAAIDRSLQKSLQEALDSRLGSVRWSKQMIGGVTFETAPVLIKEADAATEFSYYAHFSKEEPNMALLERVGGPSNTREYAEQMMRLPRLDSFD
ncbi:MAG: hypothetical protein HY901_31300 [Deltaproteobacteria bacterium]|nr:hypothetical protein [Deltaproteobacteria bacterium]